MDNLREFLTLLEDQMPLTIPTPELLDMSAKLTSSLGQGLQHSAACMLPSHVYGLPSGKETGTYLSVDLGGSTLRVALVRLNGIASKSHEGSSPIEIVQTAQWGGAEIDHLKSLQGESFFDWIASRIAEVVGTFGRGIDDQPLEMGLSWSFPIGQTSLDSGSIHGMGKGFRVAEGLVGTDLKSHFMNAFQRKSLNITLSAIINDTIAVLLSHAYIAPGTRQCLILGTGSNAAISLPVSSLPSNKRPVNVRPSANVLINTELSMFGKDIFPVTKYDDILDAAMERPGFQPFEYLVSGRYLGEIGRLVAIEGGLKNGLFANGIPQGWTEQYGVETKLMGCIEEDSSEFSRSFEMFDKHHPSSNISKSDLMALKQMFNLISNRAAMYIAVAMHGLDKLRKAHLSGEALAKENAISPIAFVGSTMEKYPHLRERTQQILDRITGWTPESNEKTTRLVLEISEESTIFGPAVAVAAAAAGTTAPPTPTESKPSTFVNTKSPLSVNSPTANDFPSKEVSSYSTISSASMDDKTILREKKDSMIASTTKTKTKPPAPSRGCGGPFTWIMDLMRKVMIKLRGN